jgi:hypothetical protein
VPDLPDLFFVDTETLCRLQLVDAGFVHGDVHRGLGYRFRWRRRHPILAAPGLA